MSPAAAITGSEAATAVAAEPPATGGREPAAAMSQAHAARLATTVRQRRIPSIRHRPSTGPPERAEECIVDPTFRLTRAEAQRARNGASQDVIRLSGGPVKRRQGPIHAVVLGDVGLATVNR